MSSISLRHLGYFQAVARHGGIAQAARAIPVSHPAVAQAIGKLEETTGLKLFDRHHALGLTLTGHGRVFLQHAEMLLDQAEQLGRLAAALAAGTAGEIRVGCFFTIAAFHLPAVMRRYSARFPGIMLQAMELDLDQLGRALKENRIDAALTYETGTHLEGLDILRLQAIEPTVLVAAGHPLAGRRAVWLRDLANDPYVMFDAAGSREYFLSLLKQAGVVPRIGYATTSLEGVRSAVGNGLGYSIVALRPDNGEAYDGSAVRALGLHDRLPPLHVVLATRPGARAGAPLKDFARTAVEHFSEAAPRPARSA